MDVTEITTQAKQSFVSNVGYPVLKQQQNNLYTVDGLRVATLVLHHLHAAQWLDRGISVRTLHYGRLAHRVATVLAPALVYSVCQHYITAFSRLSI